MQRQINPCNTTALSTMTTDGCGTLQLMFCCHNISWRDRLTLRGATSRELCQTQDACRRLYAMQVVALVTTLPIIRCDGTRNVLRALNALLKLTAAASLVCTARDQTRLSKRTKMKTAVLKNTANIRTAICG